MKKKKHTNKQRWIIVIEVFRKCSNWELVKIDTSKREHYRVF